MPSSGSCSAQRTPSRYAKAMVLVLVGAGAVWRRALRIWNGLVRLRLFRLHAWRRIVAQVERSFLAAAGDGERGAQNEEKCSTHRAAAAKIIMLSRVFHPT